MTAANQTDTEIRPVMTVAETSKMLGTDPRTISKAIENGTVQAIRIGRRTLVLARPLRSHAARRSLMMIQSDAVKALVSLAEDEQRPRVEGKGEEGSLVRLREQDEDMSIDDAYLTLSNAFLADHTLFADHEQLSASGSVLN